MLPREPAAPSPQSTARTPAPVPDPTGDSPTLGPVLALLRRARARQRRIVLLSAGLFTLAGLAVALLPALGLASTGRPGSRGAALGLLGAVALALILHGLWRWRRGAGGLTATARLLAFRVDAPVLRQGLVPAVELAAELERGEPSRFSAALARAHIESLSQAAQAADLKRALPDRPVRRGLQAVAVAAVICVAAALLFTVPLGRGLGLLLARSEGASPAARIAEPVTGEVELTYVYPAHTGLPSRSVPGTNGEIAAPRGTLVHLRTRADREVEGAFAVVGDNALALKVEGGRDLSGTLLVEAPGSYRFRLVGVRGRVLAEGPPIPIAVEADGAPKVSIVSPATDLEIDPGTRVALKYEAEDDYGVSGITLVFKAPGASREQRVVLRRAADAPRRATGEHTWDVVALGLMAGDRVAYYLEATDNDAVSGPKRGVSKTQYLQIYSQAEHHRQVIKQIEAQWERLVTLLADRLESPERRPGGRTAEVSASQEAVDTRGLQLARDMSELARGLRKEQRVPEPLWRALQNVGAGLTGKVSATSNARSELAVWLTRGITQGAAPARRLDAALAAEIAEEERSILYLETLLDQQRIEDLITLSRELASKRRDLAGLLEKYRNAPDEQTRDQLLTQLGRLKERMAELMQRMAELSKGINDEHVNAEAVKELSESMQMMDSFDKIQDLLHQDQVEDAMKEMEKLGQMLDSLQQNLQKASGEFRGGEFRELGKELDTFAQNLDALTREQQGILQETQELRASARKGFEERLAAKGEEFVSRLRAKVAEAREHLDAVSDVRGFLRENDLHLALEAADDLDKALAVKDLDQAAQSAAKALGHAQALAEDLDRQAIETRRYPSMWQQEAEEVRENARQAQGAVPPLHEVQKELGSLFPPPSQSLSEAERQRMRELASRQQQLKGKSGELQKQMEEINGKAPVFPESARQMMGQAGERMEKAQSQLRNRNPTGAAAEERAALDQLADLKKGLEQSQGQGGQGSPVPWPWMGPGMPGGQEEGGSGETPRDQKVQVPGAEQYQVPEEYRKDILDAMKQGAPDKYRDQVKKYYEEIVK